jgi:hypothetical protein
MADAQKKIVYPHRTHLLEEQTCDVCDEPGDHLLGVSKQPYMGLWICKVPECKERAKSWLHDTTMNHKTLFDEFGPMVYVQRSNGRKESGWIIQGDAYQDEENGPFWVSVKDKHRRIKCVTLAKLRSWN